MANIKVDLKYSGIEQTQIQEYEKDIIRIHESFYLKEKILIHLSTNLYQ